MPKIPAAKKTSYHEQMIDPELLSNNQLVSQLFNIINQIPTELGWISWITSFIWHCCIIGCINFIIKHLDFTVLSRVKDNLISIIIGFLPYLGYSVKIYKFILYEESSHIFHEKVTKYLDISEPMECILDNSNFHIHIKYMENWRMPTLFYAKKNAHFINCTLYYWHSSTIDLIENLKTSGKEEDQTIFTSYDFKDDKAISRSIVSNPLIPIKNYQRLDELIIDFTEIQTCLGHKNVNAISIDGAPGLGKTSFIDYFSNKHPNEYRIIYIDMIKNYKTNFEIIFKTIQSKLESNRYRSYESDEEDDEYDEDENEDEDEDEDYEDEGEIGSEKGIIIMIDEIDKYLDMHLEYLHNKNEKEEKKHYSYDTHTNIGHPHKERVEADAEYHQNENEIQNGSYLEGHQRLKDNKVSTYKFQDITEQGHNAFGSVVPPPLKTCQNKPLLASHKEFDIRIVASEDLTRSARYLKKELLYKLFELINMKVKKPSYLLFCTNNFSSMWSDLSEKHYNHLKALHNRFIKIHFDHINKENLIEILLDINKTFETKLKRKYLEPATFNKVTDKIPEDLMLTVRQMHHTLIRTMYNIEEFVKIILNDDLDAIDQWSLSSNGEDSNLDKVETSDELTEDLAEDLIEELEEEITEDLTEELTEDLTEELKEEITEELTEESSKSKRSRRSKRHRRSKTKGT